MLSTGVRRWPLGNRLRIRGASSLRASAHAACAADSHRMTSCTLCNINRQSTGLRAHCVLYWGASLALREQAAHEGHQQLASKRTRCLRCGLALHDAVHPSCTQLAVHRLCQLEVPDLHRDLRVEAVSCLQRCVSVWSPCVPLTGPQQM